jgi:multidrug transporter EmrE-like cation transporter
MSARMILPILLSVSLSGLAQVFFKIGVSTGPVRAALAAGALPQMLLAFALSPAILAGLAMYGVGTLVWLNVLARMDLSLAYPFVGLSFLVTALFGHFLFHEAFHAGRVFGTGLVIAGIILVARP